MGISTEGWTSTGVFGRDSSQMKQSPRRRSSDGCYAPGSPVTWPVFDPEIRPLKLIRGADEIDCFSGDDMAVDFDGDGVLELANASGPNPGVYWDGSSLYYTPFSALRGVEDGVALETVMAFPGDIQYWTDITGLKSVSFLSSDIRSFFDVDGDGPSTRGFV